MGRLWLAWLVEKRRNDTGMTIEDVIESIKALVPGSRLGVNETDLGVWEVWAKKDRVAIAFASGPTLTEAMQHLHRKIEAQQEVVP